jgi:5-methyltetrahydrofolate--homocysteine methyltransferase
VAGSIGPTSHLPLEYEPLGDTSDEQYLANFEEQAGALAEGGVDLFAVETMMFPQEATAAIRACKAAADLPVMATMFFQYERCTIGTGRCGERARRTSRRASSAPAPTSSA